MNKRFPRNEIFKMHTNREKACCIGQELYNVQNEIAHAFLVTHNLRISAEVIIMISLLCFSNVRPFIIQKLLDLSTPPLGGQHVLTAKK